MDASVWDGDPDTWPHTPPLAAFRAHYEQDDNLWWMTGCGHHQNLFEAACEQLDDLTRQLDDLRLQVEVLQAAYLTEHDQAPDDERLYFLGKLNASADVLDLLKVDDV